MERVVAACFEKDGIVAIYFDHLQNGDHSSRYNDGGYENLIQVKRNNMNENWSRLWLLLNVESLQTHCNNDPPYKMASNGAMIQVQISSNMYICNQL